MPRRLKRWRIFPWVLLFVSQFGSVHIAVWHVFTDGILARVTNYIVCQADLRGDWVSQLDWPWVEEWDLFFVSYYLRVSALCLQWHLEYIKDMTELSWLFCGSLEKTAFHAVIGIGNRGFCPSLWSWTSHLSSLSLQNGRPPLFCGPR